MRGIKRAQQPPSVVDHDWLAGDAVLIAPVSGQIPCEQGILQGNPQFWRLRRQYLRQKCRSRSDFSGISLEGLTGKTFRRTGKLSGVSRN
jgi:hypothetical protein